MTSTQNYTDHVGCIPAEESLRLQGLEDERRPHERKAEMWAARLTINGEHVEQYVARRRATLEASVMITPASTRVVARCAPRPRRRRSTARSTRCRATRADDGPEPLICEVPVAPRWAGWLSPVSPSTRTVVAA